MYLLGEPEMNLTSEDCRERPLLLANTPRSYDFEAGKAGDRQLRALLYEAAAVLLTRVRKPWEAAPSNVHHAAASCRPRRLLRNLQLNQMPL
jgi:hypothetical protein